MQIKTIEKTITKKLNEWLETITDKYLREKVKSNLLLSGGSITSLLLDANVNDYDIYIKDIDVLKELTEYYIKPYSTDIELLDGRNKEIYIDELKHNYDTDDEEDIKNAYAISIQNLKEDQIKLFFNSKRGEYKVNSDKKDDQNKINNEDEDELKYQPVFFSPNAISLSDNIQIVIRFHGDNEAIHKTFDFIHATIYFTFDSGLVTNVKALESILTKQLSYQGSLYPLTSIIRMKKFIKRGWNINAGEILKVMFQISELDLKDPNVLEEQLIGVDVAYFAKLIEILRGVDAKDITSQYLNDLIDKVFNSSDDINEE